MHTDRESGRKINYRFLLGLAKQLSWSQRSDTRFGKRRSVGGCDKFFIRRLLAKRALKARPHCSKRSQYRRAWRQVGQTYQRASSEGLVPLACRDMRAPGRVG